MGILLFELFRNPLFMGILNKWETLVTDKQFDGIEIFYCKKEEPKIKGPIQLELF